MYAVCRADPGPPIIDDRLDLQCLLLIGPREDIEGQEGFSLT